MSADNYYLIRRAPSGKYVALMGSASESSYPEVDSNSTYDEFDTHVQALLWAQKQGAEYGASLHDECADWKLSKSDKDDVK